jgi:hypothetical protein
LPPARRPAGPPARWSATELAAEAVTRGVVDTVQRKVVEPQDFDNFDALARRRLAFQDRYNATAEPFDWREFWRARLGRRRMVPAAFGVIRMVAGRRRVRPGLTAPGVRVR